jgi:hypothetical protein
LKVAPFASTFIPGVGPLVAPALAMASKPLQKALFEQRHVRPELRNLPEPEQYMPAPQYAPQPGQAMPSELWSLPQYALQYAQQYAPQPQYPGFAAQWGG